MCWFCVEDYLEHEGKVVVTSATLAVGPLIRQLYATEWGSVGGPLHITLDDTNVDDGCLDFCRGSAAKARERGSTGGGHRFDDEDYALCIDILDLLGSMSSEGERALAVNLAHSNEFERAVMVVGTVVQWCPTGGMVLSSLWPRAVA